MHITFSLTQQGVKNTIIYTHHGRSPIEQTILIPRQTFSPNLPACLPVRELGVVGHLAQSHVQMQRVFSQMSLRRYDDAHSFPSRELTKWDDSSFDLRLNVTHLGGVIWEPYAVVELDSL